MRLRLVCLAVLIGGVSLSALAYEAPVVDATASGEQSLVTGGTQQQSTEQNTGNSWQSVSGKSDSANSASSQSGWRSVPSNNNAQPQQLSTQQSSQAYQPAPQQMLAEAPNNAVPHPNALNQRVTRLEQQMANSTSMNLSQQVSDLRNQVSQLQGQLEVDQHELAALTKQQKLYYQDIEQQLSSSQAIPNKKAQLTDESTVSAQRTAENNPSANLDNGNTVKKTQLASVNPATETQFHDMDASKKTPSFSDADSYNQAFRLLSEKHFSSATTAFNAYLTNYPTGHFSVNAHFWLGEIALMNEKYKAALQQFQTVVAEYPTSSKVSDAKLKIAMIHAATGKMTLARKEFSQIRKTYPGTTAAQLASIRLQQLANATSTALE